MVIFLLSTFSLLLLVKERFEDKFMFVNSRRFLLRVGGYKRLNVMTKSSTAREKVKNVVKKYGKVT